MAKWQNYSFRETSTGDTGWSGGAIADPQDASNDSNVVLPGTAFGDGLDLAANGLDYGKRGAAATPGSGDVTPTNAGNDPLLGGYHSNTVNSCHYSIGCSPGAYDVRLAVGHQSAAVNTIAVFDGLFDNLVTELGISVHGPKLWTASTAYTTSDFVLSPADRFIWDCTTAGTSGSTAPSGGNPGDTFSDGSAVWTKTARQALLLFANVTNTGGSGYVIDQNGAVVTAANWAAQTPVSLTVSGDHGNGFCIVKVRDLAVRPRQFSFRAQQTPFSVTGTLDEATWDESYSDSLTASGGTAPYSASGLPQGLSASVSGGTINITGSAN